ncbi:MAG: PorV/PorQ family protein [Candidatus Zixiibacteriota bacterium]
MRRLFLITLLAMAALAGAGHDAIAGVSDAGVLFLRIAAGARAAGMGEAFVAVADDATATHWNPAGLGSYPLTSDFHQISIRDDRIMRERAVQVLKGEVEEDYSETIGQFLFRKDGIVRIGESGKDSFLEFDVDTEIPVVQFIASNARLEDRDLLKMGVRAIASENTGVTFDQIDGQRARLLGLLDENQTTEVNGLFETIVADWQNLRIVPESVTFLEEKLNFVLEDGVMSPDEYSEVVETLAKTSKTYRPGKVKVPYEVLIALWKDYSLPWETQILDIALLKNDIPSDNYSRYDIWALVPGGLTKWNGADAWNSSLAVYPNKADYITDLISSYADEADEARLNALRQQVAALNYGITKDRIEDIIEKIRSAFAASSDAILTDVFETDLNDVLIWYDEMNLDPDLFTRFVQDYDNAIADDDLTSAELSKLEFSLHKSHSGRIPRVIYLPYALPFTADPTCIAATDKLLWVGTDDGLFLFNGRAWQRYTIEDGLPSTKINALSVFDKNRLWVATGRGVAYYYRGTWSFYASETGLEDIEFTSIYGYSRDKAWAAAGNRLFFFNGDTWRSDYQYTAVVNDSLTRMVREFSGVYDNDYIRQKAAEIKTKNNLASDYPEPGTEIAIPFEIAFRHPITSMVYDHEHSRLWVGTTHGLKIFGDGRFKVFGYKAYTAQKDMTVLDIAKDYLTESGSGKAEQLATLIKSYNYIDGDNISAGQTVYVYANPLGSYINSIGISSGNIFVGTNFGTIRHSGEKFSRYYHNDLEREKTVRIYEAGGDMWFATPQHVVVYAAAKKEITLMHANYAPELASDLYYEYLSYVQSLGDDWGTIGVNATFMSYGAIPRTLEANSAVVDTFHAFDGALSLTYGANVSQGLSVGISAKIIYSKLSDQGSGAEIGSGTATAFAVDAGILYRTPIPKLTLGAALTNLGPNIAYIDAAQSDPLPRNLAVGLAYDLLRNPYNKLTLIGEVNKRITDLNDGFSEELKEAIQNVGFEYWYGSFIALRAGYKNDDVGSINYFTVGAGLQFRQLRFDFAYIPSSETVPLANTLRISLTGRL